MKDVIEQRIISEDNSWVLGKTYVNNTYFGDWCRYKKGGNPPTFAELEETERKRIEKADAYWRMKNEQR
jgi:hypothetical protein